MKGEERREWRELCDQVETERLNDVHCAAAYSERIVWFVNLCWATGCSVNWGGGKRTVEKTVLELWYIEHHSCWKCQMKGNAGTAQQVELPLYRSQHCKLITLHQNGPVLHKLVICNSWIQISPEDYGTAKPWAWSEDESLVLVFTLGLLEQCKTPKTEWARVLKRQATGSTRLLLQTAQLYSKTFP